MRSLNPKSRNPSGIKFVKLYWVDGFTTIIVHCGNITQENVKTKN